MTYLFALALLLVAAASIGGRVFASKKLPIEAAPVFSIDPVLPRPQERGEGRDALAMLAPFFLLVNIPIIHCVGLQGNSVDFWIAISRFINYILHVLNKIPF